MLPSWVQVSVVLPALLLCTVSGLTVLSRSVQVILSTIQPEYCGAMSGSTWKCVQDCGLCIAHLSCAAALHLMNIAWTWAGDELGSVLLSWLDPGAELACELYSFYSCAIMWCNCMQKAKPQPLALWYELSLAQSRILWHCTCCLSIGV